MRFFELIKNKERLQQEGVAYRLIVANSIYPQNVTFRNI